MIGKLKHSLKERCPECGSVLQLREISETAIVNGFIAEVAREVICCSNKSCYYQREVEEKRRRSNSAYF